MQIMLLINSKIKLMPKDLNNADWLHYEIRFSDKVEKISLINMIK